jgi:hypothetical protein
VWASSYRGGGSNPQACALNPPWPSPLSNPPPAPPSGSKSWPSDWSQGRKERQGKFVRNERAISVSAVKCCVSISVVVDFEPFDIRQVLAHSGPIRVSPPGSVGGFHLACQ